MKSKTIAGDPAALVISALLRQTRAMDSGYRESYRWSSGLTPAVRLLLVANIAVYLVKAILDRVTHHGFTTLFGLSAAGLRHGFVWQPITYMFVHGPVLHLVVNMLILFFMGPETERGMGTRHFAALYGLSGVLGGVGWLLISPSNAPCVGASGAIFGILGAFAGLFPRRPVTLLLFYILPVTMSAWIMVAGLTLIELGALVAGVGGHVAYAAHISGVVAGYVYAVVVFRPESLPWAGARRRVAASRDNRLPAEVDRILDKIAREGLGSLTPRERELLERESARRRDRA